MSLRRLGALGLTSIETVLIYGGIPALVILVVMGLVFANDLRRGGTKRYRPGRPFEFRPVWFLSALERETGDGATGPKALHGAEARPALPPSGQELRGPSQWPAGDREQQSTTGGASDRW